MYKKIDLTKLNIEDNYLPESFNGCRILHVSDLHNCDFGDRQEKLIQLSRQQKPDYIFITGDMIDQYHAGMKQACLYIRGLIKIAPVFYVTGNHEWEIQEEVRRAFFSFLRRSGVVILHDEIVELKKEESSIQLIGIDDPYAALRKLGKIDDSLFAKYFLKRLSILNQRKKGMYTILLSHRPEFINYYSKVKINLVFSGHAHGGQFRLPILGSVLAPHQGFFPKYAEGIICKEDTSMIVSRGLGDSLFPVRIGNFPELLLVTLYKK